MCDGLGCKGDFFDYNRTYVELKFVNISDNGG